MQTGLFLTMPAPQPQAAATLYARAIDMAEAADQLGFSHFWLAEHHFTNYSASSRPLQLLAHIAARTRRLRLGPAIIPVPLHHPLIVAEELATLDVLSQGRAEIGLGYGYQAYQYERFGVRRERTAGRDEEAIDVLLRALREPVFDFDGEHFAIPRTQLVPQPLQPRMPAWLVVNSSRRESVARALARGANLFTGVLEPISRLTDMRTHYPDLFAPWPATRVGTQRPVYVAQSEAEASEAIEHARWNGRATLRLRHGEGNVIDGVVPDAAFPDEPTERVLRDDFLVIGTADECIHQLRRIRRGLGCDYFSASFWFGALQHAQVITSIRRFAADVLPVLVEDTQRERAAAQTAAERDAWKPALAW
ncbi:LLM class flavin-dependent oxidoreductase [Paraburkholderia tropica]|uniref:Flavin-dependent oxidoreductase, luciferase family (Includes alkanesulfonate monooxygenase SsuD and methylene tetrahydromethanopterin reductase) n=1 Tax=Paraburkholderia tropica TaxID=92647 RepID=A0AAQ1JSX5_9BURK|nr:LLM class flavin-dependent oxidoreductase [Paraburkholderia tropica]RQN39827.1 LLM class flavin-dependent oxidoreductase [Paraburkholderia tropica]SEJ26283.1 Flavin-dependent oxidoreductase, luciferase family (includes alkanesulfonate monooxygenase SsuD and methylene tetrahydromethanopterin reductase) [Paraburkholderia tropica]